MAEHLVRKAKDKNKIKTYEQKAIFLSYKVCVGNSFWLGWVSFHCVLKMDKQDLQAEES